MIYVDLVEHMGEITRIRTEEAIGRTWRLVGKALSLNAIEIIDRNELERTYSTQYDPDFKKVTDGSLWDEIMFVFAPDPAQEEELEIRLAEIDSLTEITVHDTNGVPLSEGAGLELLEILYKSMRDDLVEID